MLKTRRLRPDEEDHNTYHLAVRIREQQQYYNYFYPTALSQINQSINYYSSSSSVGMFKNIQHFKLLVHLNSTLSTSATER